MSPERPAPAAPRGRRSIASLAAHALLGAVAVLAAAAGVPAHARQVPPGVLRGRVVDAGTSLPVVGALVTLEPETTGLLVNGLRGGEVAAARSTVTAASGIYYFRDVAPGTYRLRVERLGYRSVSLELEVRRPSEALVSVGLELEPVELEGVRVIQRAASLYERAANRATEPDEARVAAERSRQALFLSPDARVVTAADVMDGVTLGEGDVFRALQRFAGVGTRDDYTAELWTRGAPWTHTRVTFDGIPLFNPVHAVGVLSAISPEVLGAVFFHPGVRPASLAEGAAGVVDLRSRPGAGTGDVRAAADLSVGSAKLAADQYVPGRGGWVVVGRRSHLGTLSAGLDRLGLDTLDLPYSFHDLAGRIDIELGGRAGIEASGLLEEDRLTGDVAGVLERTHARWGNRAGRVTARFTLGGIEFRQTVGGSQFHAQTDAHVVPSRVEPAWTEPPSWNEIRYAQIAGEARAARSDGGTSWAVGYDVALSRGTYEGPAPRYYAVKPDTVRDLRLRSELLVASLWAEGRIPLGERLELGPGVRLEGGDEVANGPALRASPRFSLRYHVSPDQSISAAVGRSWQYVQAIGLAGPSFHPAFHASHFWVFAGDSAPAVRTDMASVGTERWLGGGWLVSATAYVRRSTGVTVPDPTPGPVRGRLLYVSGENRAHGFELGARRIGARWSASVGYGYGVSEMLAAGWRYPAPADRRHTVDVMAGFRILPSVRLSAAFSAMSGAPFTRARTRTPADCEAFGFGCGTEGGFTEAPNDARTPAYASLDASLHWGRPVGPVEVGAYVQLRNVLGRDNASTYAGSRVVAREILERVRGETQVRYIWEDHFERGLPRLPLVGVRVTF